MGHRCNLVVVDRGGPELYYSHWAANELHHRVAFGPRHVLAFARAQQRLDPDRPDDWLDDVWAEGAVLVDVASSRMLWFGHGLDDIAVARAHRRLLALTWPGWTVEWARDGLGDVVAALGRDRASVRGAGPDDGAPAPAWEPEQIVAGPDDDIGSGEQGSHQVVTVTGPDGRTAAWLAEGHDEAVELGPGVLDRLPGPRYDHVRQRVLPDCGLHVDVAARRAGAWSVWALPGSADRVPARWAGWTLEFWGDRIEQHVAAAAGAFEVPPVDELRGVRRLAEWLDVVTPDPVGSVGDVVGTLRADGRDVVVSDAFSRHVRTEPDAVDRERLRTAWAELAAGEG